MKPILLTILFFYTLALLETSFLGHFNIFGGTPNLLLLATVLINIFEPAKEKSGIIGAATAGFFWDVFSSQTIGFHLLILLGSSLFIKIIFKRYFKIPNYLSSRS